MPIENTTPSVEYRLVPGFPLYRVGTDGTIWSRWTGRGRHSRIDLKWNRLACYAVPKGRFAGYTSVALRNHSKEKAKRIKVHTLVLTAFVGPRPDGMEACHKNGNRSDNRLENLRWGTHQSNIADTMSHGTTNRGEKNPSAKLIERDVKAIREMANQGTPIARISTRFGVSRRQVGSIVNRKHWKHLA